MKMALLIFCVLWALATPAFAELTPQDLDKIRLIVKEEVDPIKAEISSMKAEISFMKAEISFMKTEISTLKSEVKLMQTDIAALKENVATLNGYVSIIEKPITWLMGLIVIAVGVPPIIVAWRSQRNREYEKRIEERAKEQDERIETLIKEMETLKHQGIVNP